MKMIASGEICSCPTASSDLPALHSLRFSLVAEPPLLLVGFAPTPCIFPPLSAAAPKLPFSELLLRSSCSPQVCYQVPPSLSVLVSVLVSVQTDQILQLLIKTGFVVREE